MGCRVCISSGLCHTISHSGCINLHSHNPLSILGIAHLIVVHRFSAFPFDFCGVTPFPEEFSLVSWGTDISMFLHNFWIGSKLHWQYVFIYQDVQLNISWQLFFISIDQKTLCNWYHVSIWIFLHSKFSNYNLFSTSFYNEKYF